MTSKKRATDSKKELSKLKAFPNDIRQCVIDIAVEVVATEGPEAVSLRDIARRAGMSHMAPYYYFGDRAGVFAAIAEDGYRLLEESMLKELNETADVVASFIHSYVNFAVSHPGYFRVMFRSELAGMLTHEDTITSGNHAFDAVVEQVVTHSSMFENEADPVEISLFLWTHAHGIATLILDGPLLGRTPPDLTTEDIISQAIERLKRTV